MKTNRPLLFLMLSALLFARIFSGDAGAADRGFTVKTERYALLIGNGDYKEQAALQNPVNDVRDMANALQSMGFHVVKKENAKQREMEDAIQNMGERLRKGGEGTVGLFYFAGHGVQSDNQNYLIPIGAKIAKETDIKYMAVNANWVLESMSQNSESLNIVILDACRSKYPFTRKFRSRTQGLAPMTSDLMTGALVAFSTSPGNVSSDGDGRNGVFTKYLLKHIKTPGLEIEDILKLVRIDVAKETGKQQIPWAHSSLLGEFYFIQPKNYPKIVQQDSRFAAYENGTVTDKKKGLMWTRRASGKNMDWQSAKQYCDKLVVGKYKDWRLPSISELRSLFDPRSKSVQKCSRKPVYITNLIHLTCGGIWSSESRENGASFFNFATGHQLWYYPDSPDMAGVLAVRRVKTSVAASE